MGEPKALTLPKNINEFVASEILKIECFRTIDRIRHVLNLSEDEVANRHAGLHKAIRSIRMVKFSDSISQRACDPFPVTLKTLDAIHLSTAVLWRQHEKKEILFLTHDDQLSKAARSLGFEVLG
jgi:hypothetical protein